MSRTKRTTNFHHLYYPRTRYQTELEKTFRELPCLKVEMEVGAHNLLHYYHDPPRKPAAHDMVDIIRAHEQGLCTCKTTGNEGERRRRAT